MSYSPGIGLILNLGLDASGVDTGLNDAEKALGGLAEKTGEQFADAGKKTDDALLSNRESVRLLSEEMGVHLPRAVSGALAEMLPGINAIGPALLGAFALAEIPKFIQGVEDAASALGGYTKAVQSAEKADIEASNSALVHFKTIANGVKFIADTNRALLELAARQGSWKTDIEGAGKAMDDSKGILLSLLGPVGEGINLWRGYKGAVKEAGDAETEAANLRERLIQQLNQLTSLEQKRTSAISASTEVTERNRLTEGEWRKEMIKGGQEAGKVAAAIAKYNLEMAASAVKAAQDELKFTLQLEQFGIVSERDLSSLKQYAPVMNAATTATKHLSAARKELIGISQEATQVEDALKEATQGQTDAIIAGTNALSGIVDNITQLMGNTKASAEIRGAYDAALAIEWWARFIASYGTDAQAALTATEYSLAAAEMFKVAGSVHSSPHLGGGGGSAAGREGGQTGPQAPGAMGTEVPITPGFTSVGGGGAGASLTVHVYGPSQEALHIASVLNNYTTRQGGSLVASRSIAPPKAGR
jgi:hypothetical protein